MFLKFMNSMTCAVFDAELAKFLGKRESESDLEFYHRSHNGKVLTFILPASYPDKINSLLQALFLSKTVLLEARRVDAVLGELIVAIDSMQKEKGFIILAPEVDESMFNKLVSGTTLEKFERITRDEMLDRVAQVELPPEQGGTVVDLDSMFNVKGIGEIGLGFVASGQLKKFDKLKVLPPETEVVVKSIQKQDKDFNEAEPPERVGLALKGIEAKDFSRGFVLTNDPAFSASRQFSVEFHKSKYFKKELSAQLSLQLQCRCQITGCKIVSAENPLKIETAKPIALQKGEKITLVDVDSKPRIIGSGKIV